MACDSAACALGILHPPSGRLPFELPSSMEAVRAQKEDVPHDWKDPLYPFGHGVTVKR